MRRRYAWTWLGAIVYVLVALRIEVGVSHSGPPLLDLVWRLALVGAWVPPVLAVRSATLRRGEADICGWTDWWDALHGRQPRPR